MLTIQPFSLKDFISIKHMVDISFSNFAEVKRNSTKSEIVSIGVLKGTQVAVRGMDCIDVMSVTRLLQ